MVQILKRLQDVLVMEKVSSNEEGLEALVFTAEGDMRQALNNAQATHSGFGFISSENVFKVCRDPSWRISARCDMICHPLLRFVINRIPSLCANCSMTASTHALTRRTISWSKCGLRAIVVLISLAHSSGLRNLITCPSRSNWISLR